MKRGWRILLSCLVLTGASGAAHGQAPGNELDALDAAVLRSATALVQVKQEREEVDMHNRQLAVRAGALRADYAVNGNDVDRFNGQCAGGRTFVDPPNNPEYHRCQTWQNGIVQRREVLHQNGEAIRRDERNLQARDNARVARAAEALAALMPTLVRIETLCARLPAGARAARCHHLNFDPRIQVMMASLQTLATTRSRECLQLPALEQLAECARAPFDLSNFEITRPLIFENYEIHSVQ